MNHAKFGKIDQIGIVVPDIDTAIKTWTQRMGIGPWTLFKNVRITGELRGEPCSVTFEVAMGYQGDTQIELMQMTSDVASPYRSNSGDLLLGMHHVAWLVDDLDVTMAQATADGMKLVFKATGPGTRVAYMEIDDQPGMMFEFIESAQTRALMRDGLAASRNWDGTNAVTIFDFASF